MSPQDNLPNDSAVPYLTSTPSGGEKPGGISSANGYQISGDHYKTQAIQVWDYITSNGIPYLEGNAIKYLSRWRAKGGLQDLLKAKHYVEKLIENEQQRLATEKAQAEAPSYPELAGPGDAFRPGKDEYQRPTKRKKR